MLSSSFADIGIRPSKRHRMIELSIDKSSIPVLLTSADIPVLTNAPAAVAKIAELEGRIKTAEDRASKLSTQYESATQEVHRLQALVRDATRPSHDSPEPASIVARTERDLYQGQNTMEE